MSVYHAYIAQIQVILILNVFLIRKESFVRHTLSTGYKPLNPGQGKGAPGSPLTVHIDNSR